MKLIVGLGNPGEKYQKTRHNVGFMVVDRLGSSLQPTAYSKKSKNPVWEINKKLLSVICRLPSAILAKPQTFVNQSGEAVAKIASFYKIKPKDILVIRDDVDMELGKVRGPKDQTGSGGHKGVESIIEKLGGEDFYQLKIGVGRPLEDVETEKWVLSDFSADEMEKIEALNLEELILGWRKLVVGGI